MSISSLDSCMGRFSDRKDVSIAVCRAIGWVTVMRVLTVYRSSEHKLSCVMTVVLLDIMETCVFVKMSGCDTEVKHWRELFGVSSQSQI